MSKRQPTRKAAIKPLVKSDTESDDGDDDDDKVDDVDQTVALCGRG